MRRILRLAPAVCSAALTLTACGSSGADSAPPPTPAGVTAQAGTATSVHVMWRQAAGDGADRITGYEVYRGGVKVKDVGPGLNMIDITGLEPSRVYSFTVRARDTDGALSPHSAAGRATTPAVARADNRAPARPTGLRGGSDGPRGARLTWQRPTGDQGITSYDIHQGGTKIHSVGGDATGARLTRLRPGTHYRFAVTARDAADNTSPVSRTVEITTPRGPGDDPATAPTGFRVATHADAGAHYLDLSWLAPDTGAPVPSYEIYLDGVFATTLVWGGSAPSGRASHSVYAGREPGTVHTVKIRAMLPDGTWGRFSPERTVVTGGRP